jgi:hypothetical protein
MAATAAKVLCECCSRFAGCGPNPHFHIFFSITQVRLGLSIRGSFILVHISSLSTARSVKKSKFVSDYLQPKDRDMVNACTSVRACGDNFSTMRRSLDSSKKIWIESKNTVKRTALKFMLTQKFGRSFCHHISSNLLWLRLRLLKANENQFLSAYEQHRNLIMYKKLIYCVGKMPGF